MYRHRFTCCACSVAYLSSFLLSRPDRWPIHSVDSVVQAARVAQVMARAVPSPQRRHVSRTIHAFFHVHVHQTVCEKQKRLHDIIIL